MWQGLFATTCIFGFWGLQKIYNATHFKEMLELHQAESQEEIDELLQKIEELEEELKEKKQVQEKQDRLIAELNLALATFKEKFNSLQKSYDTLREQNDNLLSYFKAQKSGLAQKKEPIPIK